MLTLYNTIREIRHIDNLGGTFDTKLVKWIKCEFYRWCMSLSVLAMLLTTSSRFRRMWKRISSSPRLTSFVMVTKRLIGLLSSTSTKVFCSHLARFSPGKHVTWLYRNSTILNISAHVFITSLSSVSSAFLLVTCYLTSTRHYCTRYSPVSSSFVRHCASVYYLFQR